MKKTQCQAITISAKSQCSNNAMPGTNYCWHRYPKKEPIILLLLGALLGLGLQVLWDRFTISQEEQEIIALRKKVESTQKALVLQKANFIKNYMQETTEEVGKNLEIAHKWKASIAKQFPWMETFSMMMYNPSIIGLFILR